MNQQYTDYLSELETVKAERDALAAKLEKAERISDREATGFRAMCEAFENLEAIVGLDTGGGMGPGPALNAVESIRRERDELASRLGRTKGEGCVCQGCGKRYHDDLIVPDDIWERIKPEGKAEGAGLLCGACIHRRVVEPMAAHMERLRECIENCRTHTVQNDVCSAYFNEHIEKRLAEPSETSLALHDAELLDNAALLIDVCGEARFYVEALRQAASDKRRQAGGEE